jgi:hypothetical protein
MLKKIMVILLLLVGCTTNQTQLDKTMIVDLFYLNTCSECKAFKKNAIPYLEKKFGDNIVINQYDLDDSSTTELYDSFVDSLEDFDEEFYGYGPFVVVEDYFAILGYTTGDEKYLSNDIIAATKGNAYSDELEGIRFEFK